MESPRPLPAPWTSKEPCILGIDEAGRGPCLGPMVYASAFCAKKDERALNALGADDSKQLTEEQRNALRKKLDDASFVGTDSIILHAAELSASMLRPAKYNLNLISHDTALSLVQRAMDAGVNVTEVYVDTVGNANSYAEKFRDAFPSLKKVVVAAKADSIYKIVSAASIVAKTDRDLSVSSWVFAEEERSKELAASGNVGGVLSFSRDYGSGYPSDPRTKKWLLNHVDNVFGFPSFVRFSWGTAKRLLEEQKAIDVSWECDDETEETHADESTATESAPKKRRKPTSTIDNFFGSAPKRGMLTPRFLAQRVFALDEALSLEIKQYL